MTTTSLTTLTILTTTTLPYLATSNPYNSYMFPFFFSVHTRARAFIMSFLPYGNGQRHGSSRLTRAIAKKRRGLIHRPETSSQIYYRKRSTHTRPSASKLWRASKLFCPPDEMCIDRILMWGIDCFVNELLDGGAQGLCEPVCIDKCYCKDLAADDKCECNGIPLELKDKMKSCSVQYIPDDNEFRSTSKSMLFSLQVCKPSWYQCKCPVTSSAGLDEWKCVTSTDCNKCLLYPRPHNEYTGSCGRTSGTN
jgi:hypothetical protein